MPSLTPEIQACPDKPEGRRLGRKSAALGVAGLGEDRYFWAHGWEIPAPLLQGDEYPGRPVTNPTCKTICDTVRRAARHSTPGGSSQHAGRLGGRVVSRRRTAAGTPPPYPGPR